MNIFSASLLQSAVDTKNNFFLSIATIVGIVMGSGLFFFSIEPKLSVVVGCLSFLIVYIVSSLVSGLSLRHMFEKTIIEKTHDVQVTLTIMRHWTAWVVAIWSVLVLALGAVFAAFGIFTGALICTIAMFVFSAPGLVRQWRA